METAHGVWYTEGGGNTTLHFDTNGSTGTDAMTIILTGVGLGLTASDFHLLVAVRLASELGGGLPARSSSINRTPFAHLAVTGTLDAFDFMSSSASLVQRGGNSVWVGLRADHHQFGWVATVASGSSRWRALRLKLMWNAHLLDHALAKLKASSEYLCNHYRLLRTLLSPQFRIDGNVVSDYTHDELFASLATEQGGR